MVLVVLFPLPEGELEDRAGYAAQVDGLLHAVLGRVSQVGEQRVVEDALDLLGPVLLGLPCGEVPLEEQDGVLGRVIAVGRVRLLVEGRLDVGVDRIGHRVVRDDRFEYLLVGLHAKRLHEGDEGNGARCHGDGHHEHSVLLLLDEGQGAVAFPLGKHLGGLHGRSVFLVVLDHDPVGRQVFERYQGPLGPSDYEVPSGLLGVLLVRDKRVVVFFLGEAVVEPEAHDVPVEVASPGLDHHRHVSDPDPFVPFGDGDLLSVLEHLEAHVNGREIVQVPEPGLHGHELVAVSVGLHDLRGLDAYGRLRGRVDTARLGPRSSDADLDVPSAGALRVEPDRPACGVVRRYAYVVDDPLHPAVRVVGRGQEVVERGYVVVYYVAFREIKVYEVSHAFPPVMSL